MLRAYAQLLRIPNVFTAMADVCMGWMVAQGAHAGTVGLMSGYLPSRGQLPVLLSLLLVSACLYCAGMVLNDYFDREEDRRERPFRPIPSGRISPSAALILGLILISCGVCLAWATSPIVSFCWNCAAAIEAGITWRPGYIATPLAACVILYDGWLKRTWLGPIGMGACRFLNVLLGLSALGQPPPTWMWHLASVIGIYIVGVTWFARTEAVTSKKAHLAAATSVMGAALVLVFLFPLWWDWPLAEQWHWDWDLLLQRWLPYMLLLAAWTKIVEGPVSAALREPRPENVQAAVKRCILGLIGLDALLAFVVVGWPGLLILLLLPPALLLGRWVYST